ncbi:MAG: copper amine oxidase N-terminal domain-containing protein [Peptococcaceae bacterium]|nr:copper amine oxidase N-terminal domain-containing protein [Peptococcaceae bacterium]
MNKISKKIVALATMAAFVLTLVPAAAFADAGDGLASVQTSEFTVVDKSGNATDDITVDINEAVTAKFIVRDENNQGTDLELGAAQAVKIWAVDNKTQEITDALVLTAIDGYGATESYKDNVYKTTAATDKNSRIAVSFTRSGDYTLFAGVGDITSDGNMEAVQKVGGTPSVIHVEADDVVSTSAMFAGDPDVYTDGEEKNIDATSLITNDIDSLTVSGTIYDQNGEYAEGETFTLTPNRDELSVSPATITTDAYGAFKFEISVAKAGDYKLYMSNEDMDLTLNIQGNPAELDVIKTIESDGQTLLAGNDKQFKDNYTTNGTNVVANYFAKAVQFEITDEYGRVVSEDVAINNEPASDKNGKNGQAHDKYLKVESKPDDSDLNANDLVLAWSPSVQAYTLQYVGTDARNDLIPGEYTVTVSLLSGKTATATFTTALYGTTQDVVLDVTAIDLDGDWSNELNITDEVTLGQGVRYSAMYVDENGIEIKATGDIRYGVDGKAVANQYWNGAVAKYEFQTKEDVAANESLLGTVITLIAFDETVGKLVEQEVTVVDSYNTYDLAFSDDQGLANEENEVTVSVVDADGDVVDIEGHVYAYVADQSNEDAKVEIGGVDGANVRDGQADITIFSNEETTVDVVVAVEANNGPIYAGTLEYTIGDEDPLADRTVVMTIGSTDYVVNNSIVAGDAAPYVDSAWRTMVPFRVLGETFGATVNWDQDNQTVTYTVDDTELVMTIGEETYTINGEEQTMDTAPVLSGDRTYVPVRFVGEALGYTVTALQDVDTGLTASVVFQS